MTTTSNEDLIADAEALLLARDLNAAADALAYAEADGACQNRVAGDRWLLHMLRGEFESAWLQSDLLRQRDAPDPHRFWTGESLHGKRVIVRCLHGFGDAVQMLRYAPRLQRLAAEVVYEVPPRLLKLAPYFVGVEQVITWGKDAPLSPPAWELQVEVMELPYIFRTQLQDLPLEQSYLRVAPAALPKAKKPRVGIVWSAGRWDESRSIPLELLEPILRRRNFEFWNLQGQGSAGEAEHLPLRAIREGIYPLAQAIAALDLVITVDTLSAHLAGALGIPCILLLQHAADWRWLQGRSDSPWYPTLELLRQPAPGDWPGVIQQLQRRLGRFTA